MTLTKRLFKQQCVNYISKWRQFDEDWKLISQSCGKIEELDCSALKNDIIDDENLELLLSKNEVKKDTRLSDKIHTFEYNVAYSESYEVPVMYFWVSYQGMHNQLKLTSREIVELFLI